MIDINLIRNNPKEIKDKALSKGYQIDTDLIIETDNKHLSLLKEVEDLRKERNNLSSTIGKGLKPSPETIVRAKELKTQIQSKEEELNTVSKI